MAKTFFGPFSAATYQRRRTELINRLAKSSPNFVACFFSGSEVIRNHDNVFPFRANSDFLYLTGFSEPDTLVILSKENGKLITRIGLRPRDLSPNRGSEIWDGERLGVERACKTLGFDEAFDIHQGSKILKHLISQTRDLFWSLGEYADWDAKLIPMISSANKAARGLPKIASVSDPRLVLHEMRRVKSNEEIKIMRRSGQIGALGHIRAMKTLKPGMYEYQTAAEIEREFKRYGAGWVAYNSIVATGNNACTLHYHANSDWMKAGDLLLIDAGCEYQGYASDITRCYPVGGKFSDAQKEVYNLVLKSQLAAIAAVRPGVSVWKPHEAAVQILSQGLLKMGILKGKKLSDILKNKLWRRYMPHGTSHWLGLDVHDSGTYVELNDENKSIRLSVGNAFTVEPGLYFRANDSSVPAKYRGIGVRIEDDVLVTKNGCEVLSSTSPKTVEDIEALCGHRL